MRDYNKYIGIPWVCGRASMSGADCWGLVSIVYRDLFDISLEHYKVQDIDNSEKTSNKIEEVRDTSENWGRVSEPSEGDVVMMVSRATERPEHVGLYIGNNKVLHSMTRETGQSEIHDIKLIKKLFKRLEFYRYDV